MVTRRNKNRIYIALYERRGRDNYHAAILLTPKKFGSGDPSSWWFHAKNIIDPKQGREVWIYSADRITARDDRTAALVFLGKTQLSGEELKDLFATLSVLQQDPEFNCVSWMHSAVACLVDNEIVPSLPMPLDDLYATAWKLADVFVKLPFPERMQRSIPTCSIAGEPIPSEVR